MYETHWQSLKKKRYHKKDYLHQRNVLFVSKKSTICSKMNNGHFSYWDYWHVSVKEAVWVPSEISNFSAAKEILHKTHQIKQNGYLFNNTFPLTTLTNYLNDIKNFFDCYNYTTRSNGLHCIRNFFNYVHHLSYYINHLNYVKNFLNYFALLLFIATYIVNSFKLYN